MHEGTTALAVYVVTFRLDVYTEMPTNAAIEKLYSEVSIPSMHAQVFV